MVFNLIKLQTLLKKLPAFFTGSQKIWSNICCMLNRILRMQSTPTTWALLRRCVTSSDSLVTTISVTTSITTTTTRQNTSRSDRRVREVEDLNLAGKAKGLAVCILHVQLKVFWSQIVFNAIGIRKSFCQVRLKVWRLGKVFTYIGNYIVNSALIA